MMPNACFYKLKDMSKKKQHQISSPSSISQPSRTKQPHHFYPRKSYYFTRELVPSDGFYVSPTTNSKSAASHLPDPPRKHSQKPSRKIHTRYSFSASSSSDGIPPPQEFRSDCILTTQSFNNMVSSPHSSSCKAMNYEAKNIDDDSKKFDKLDEFDYLSELQLPRIITKPVEFNHKKEQNMEPTNHPRSSAKFVENKKTCPGRKFCVNPRRVRLRINSPKIGSIRFQSHAQKRVSSSSNSSLSNSFAVVKSSFNPQRDFRESMVEMIRENNIRASKDLEDLLACYLSLNSEEYHGLIIKVFKQIWFDLNDAQLK
ncbi:hypothetical protein V6N13_038741 [Hibiscus sabdariffa]|uniref:Transcription repressor n=1 Tax=Hibiscus sabdariffa TaxID=183260 RepID=A0ABR2P3D0_9ROSI